MPMPVQVKLLRVLQERRIQPLGDSREIAVDVRVIAATHQDLEDKIAAGTFREDLYHRLNVVRVHVPPLRERREDIPLLAQHFLEVANQDERPAWDPEAYERVVRAPRS